MLITKIANGEVMTAIRRLREDRQWFVIGILTSGVSLWQGVGYAIGGGHFTQSRGWQPLSKYVLGWCGGLHAHGAIMFALGLALAVELRGPFNRATLWTLRLLRTYCLIVVCCWFASWVTVGISWGAPAWWLLLAGLTVWLGWFAPVMSPASRRDRR